MRWKKNNGWRKRFAILPLEVEDTWIWLEFYWIRFDGLYYSVKLVNNYY